MKQHIEPEDLAQLSGEAREKLRDWWRPKEGDCYMYEYCGYQCLYFVDMIEGDEFNYGDGILTHKISDCYPLLSIGQMIEFLDRCTNEFGLHFNDNGAYWIIYYGGDRQIEYDIPEKYELCDALWEACKEVLERE